MMGPSPGLAEAEKRWHTASCVVTNPGVGDPVRNEETGAVTDPPGVEAYSGPCLVTPTGGARVVEFGEGPRTLNTYDVELDGPVAGVEVGATVAVTSANDPTFDSLDVVVLEVVRSEHVTNRQLICEGS